MEDHRDDLVVIVAGYEKEMQGFPGADPGLASRFPTTVRFPDYTDAELVSIFEHLAAAEGLTLAPDVSGRLRALLRTVPRGPSFGNGCLMRNLLDAAIAAQAQRITTGDRPDDTELTTLRAADLHPITPESPPKTPASTSDRACPRTGRAGRRRDDAPRARTAGPGGASRPWARSRDPRHGEDGGDGAALVVAVPAPARRGEGPLGEPRIS